MTATLESLSRKLDGLDRRLGDTDRRLRDHVAQHAREVARVASRNQARLNIGLAVLGPVATAGLMKWLGL